MARRQRLLRNAALLVALVLSPSAAIASPIVSGNGDNSSGAFAITNNQYPFAITNPPGPLDYRAAIEIPLEGPFLPTTLAVQGMITSEKTISLYGYTGDGVITGDDLDKGTLISSIPLKPTGAVSTIQFDIGSYLNAYRQANPGATYAGFNLRESESNGAARIIGFAVLPSPVPEATTILLWAVVLGLGAVAYRWRRKASQPVVASAGV